MESTGRGYDQNGDLRFNLTYRFYHLQPLRIHNGYLYTGSDEDMAWYGRSFSKLISWAMSSLNSTCVMLMAITMQILMM